MKTTEKKRTNLQLFRRAAALLLTAALLLCGCGRADSGHSGAPFTLPVPSVNTELPQVSSGTSEPEEAPPVEPAPEPSATQAAPPASSVPAAAAPKPSEPTPAPPPAASADEVRAVWIPFMELETMLKGRDAATFTAAVGARFDDCAAHGLNTVIVHARSHADAFYNSRIFPTSYYFTGGRAAPAPYDPLAIMVEQAHARGLRIEAWVNPYRGAKTVWPLCEDEPLAKWLGTDRVFVCGEYYYFDPGDPAVQQLVVDGVTEIVENYAVDGIHFDDYFYPSGCGDFDAARYGSQDAAQFRRDSVSRMVAAVYAAVKQRRNIPFGISPAGNYKNCMNIQYADVCLWGSVSGYVDYLAPQLYWNYSASNPLPYDRALAQWAALVTSPDVSLYVGLAAYRVGLSGWTDGDLLARQVRDARTLSRYGGFALFRSESYFSAVCDTERKNLEAIF